MKPYKFEKKRESCFFHLLYLFVPPLPTFSYFTSLFLLYQLYGAAEERGPGGLWGDRVAPLPVHDHRMGAGVLGYLSLRPVQWHGEYHSLHFFFNLKTNII